jgi:hypothetical protein
MKPESISCGCEEARRLMRSWTAAFESFARILSGLTSCSPRDLDYSRLRAEAETARLEVDNTHMLWQLHRHDHGCCPQLSRPARTRRNLSAV